MAGCGSARPFATAEHEYAHLVLNQSLPAQPVWVAEGLAELLSDGVFAGPEALLGADRPDHEALLRQAHVHLSEARAQGTELTPDVEEQIVADLELAVANNPQLYEATLLLARLRPEPYGQRIALLQPVFDAQPDRVEIAQALASLELKRWNLAAARRVLKRAREAARTPAYRFLCDHLLARLDGLAAATVEVRGRLVHLDCRPDGSLRFIVAAKPVVLRLEATSSRSFLVGSDGQMEQRLTCGSQEAPLTIRYEPASGHDPEIDGTVLWLALQPPPE